MRILLDEQLPRQLAPFLIGHEVRTVQQESWAGLKNGALLTTAEDAGLVILLTGDQNLQFQQNLAKRRIGVVVLCAVSNAIEDLLPLVPSALKVIEVLHPGQVVRVEANAPLQPQRLRTVPAAAGRKRMSASAKQPAPV